MFIHILFFCIFTPITKIKMEVIKEFFCIQEKKTYKVGDKYNGKRKDLKDYVKSESKKTIRKTGGKLQKGTNDKQS